MIIVILKLLIVVIFLALFLRKPSILNGVGLITVTTAILLDTFLGTFNRDEMLSTLGFFFYLIAGALVGGMAVWVWGLLRPFLTPENTPKTVPAFVPRATPQPTNPPNPAPAKSGTTFDRNMLYNEIRTRLGPDDVLDLLFDLTIQENEVMTLQQNMDQLIINLMDTAEQRGQTGALALAVERILTSPLPEHLPRLEKINSSSPPTILRHYLLVHYKLRDLQDIATRLNVDWEQLNGCNKKSLVRNLLLHLSRRNMTDRLIDLLHEQTAAVIENSSS